MSTDQDQEHAHSITDDLARQWWQANMGTIEDPAIWGQVVTLAFRQSEPPSRPKRRSRGSAPGDAQQSSGP